MMFSLDTIFIYSLWTLQLFLRLRVELEGLESTISVEKWIISSLLKGILQFNPVIFLN